MLFQNGKLSVRELERQDNGLLAKWLSDPAVLEYYEGRDNAFDLERVNATFYKSEDRKGQCIVEFGGKAIGYIQFYEINAEERNLYGYSDDAGIIYGTDQFIGEVEYWNKGIGKLLVGSMTDFLVHQKQAERVVMDPQAWNARAISCYEKSGFKKVKLLPKNEWHEGEYRDCWLVEYLKDQERGGLN